VMQFSYSVSFVRYYSSYACQQMIVTSHLFVILHIFVIAFYIYWGSFFGFLCYFNYCESAV